MADSAVPYLKDYYAFSNEGNVCSRIDLFCETEDKAKERARQPVADGSTLGR